MNDLVPETQAHDEPKLASQRIGILAAMPEELQSFLDAMPDEHKVTLAGRMFWTGHWHGHTVVAVLSGIGKVAAAVTTSLLIDHFDVSEVWFTGVAGGLGEGVRVGDVVVADELMQHDLDARPLFPRFEIPGQSIAVLRSHEDLVKQAVDAARSVLDKLNDMGVQQPMVHRGLIASGDQFIGSASVAQGIRDAIPGVLAVEMEGAAVAQVCHDFGVPFVVIRTVSDRADEVAHVDFQRFVTAVASPFSHALVDALLRSR